MGSVQKGRYRLGHIYKIGRFDYLVYKTIGGKAFLKPLGVSFENITEADTKHKCTAPLLVRNRFV